MNKRMYSKRRRVLPIFSALRDKHGTDWPETLLGLAQGLRIPTSCGSLQSMYLEQEFSVAPSPARLAFLLRTVDPAKLQKRVADPNSIPAALRLLDAGKRQGLPRRLILEGRTYADCLLECERMLIWIEGKCRDTLSLRTVWDKRRDQLARNLEAVATVAAEKGKDYCVLICHESDFSQAESQLIAGYRSGDYADGCPHLPEAMRRAFADRIGTVTWLAIRSHWNVGHHWYKPYQHDIQYIR